MDYSPLDRVQAPLVFGVSGHRDLREQDVAELEKKVREVLLGFRKQYPATPFILLSPLAEGADRLVARVALEPDIRARLVVPLPMPQSAFEADFTAAGSLAEFHELLGRADACWPLDVLTHQPGPERDLQYEAGGQYIARESAVLIALWNGVESELVGGTAAIVKFRTEGLAEQYRRDLVSPELFPVYHIVTPRVSNTHVAGQPLQLHVEYPPAFEDPKAAEEYYSRTFRNLDEFNGYIRDGGDFLRNEAGVSKGNLIDQAGLAKIAPNEALTLNRYSIADALAIRFQKQMLLTHRALHWLVFWSFLFLVMFAHLSMHPGLLLALSFVVFGVGFLMHRRAKSVRLDNKSQDYRAVAEACRIGLFWQIAGIDDSVAENYLREQRTELDWIRLGLRGWRLGLQDGLRPAGESANARMEFVREHWVEDQRKYFEKAAPKNLKRSEQMESWANACLLLAMGMAGLVLAIAANAQLSHREWWKCPECEWLDWPLIVIDAFLALGALLHHANDRRAHAEHRKKYQRMKNIFQNASETIQERLESNQPDMARNSLRKLGQEALAENGEWVLLHRERPMELPHP
jgi:hypothetical protein